MFVNICFLWGFFWVGGNICCLWWEQVISICFLGVFLGICCCFFFGWARRITFVRVFLVVGGCNPGYKLMKKQSRILLENQKDDSKRFNYFKLNFFYQMKKKKKNFIFFFPFLSLKNCSAYAWHLESKKPLHREVGFIRIKPGTNEVAWIGAQNLGEFFVFYFKKIILCYWSKIKSIRCKPEDTLYFVFSDCYWDVGWEMNCCSHVVRKMTTSQLYKVPHPHSLKGSSPNSLIFKSFVYSNTSSYLKVRLFHKE